MKRILIIFKYNIIDIYTNLRTSFEWMVRGFIGNRPQFIKKNVFKKFGIKNAQWVETGTFRGTSTSFFLKIAPKVFSIEPSEFFYKNALKRFETKKNVEIFFGSSEEILPNLLPKIHGDCNFWLDGHYSGGDTFQGENNCPIPQELELIKKNKLNFNKILILIDDVRLFVNHKSNNGYPSINFLVGWAKEQDLHWEIESDIFIMRNF